MARATNAALDAGRTCPAPAGHMYYRRGGSGPTLLCLHGLGGGSGYWEGLAGALADRRTCLAPDLLGFGRSAWPDLDYSPAAHITALEAVLADAAVDPPYDLVGHSAGGVLALDLARALGGRARSLVLICAPYPKREATTPYQLWPHEAAEPGSRRARRIRQRMAVASFLWRRLISVYPPRGYPRPAVWNYLNYSMWAYLDTAARLLHGRDMAADLALLRDVPALLLYGRGDRQAPPAAGEAYHTLLRNSRLLAFPSGHQLLIDRACASAAHAAIREWLQRPTD